MATALQSIERPRLDGPAREGRMLREICLIAVRSTSESATTLKHGGTIYRVSRRESHDEVDYLYLSPEDPAVD
jgi:hypothetical protein